MHWCVILNVYFLWENPGWKMSSPIWRWKFSHLCNILILYTGKYLFVCNFSGYICILEVMKHIIHTSGLTNFLFFEYVAHIFRAIVSKHSSKIIHTFQILFGLFLFVTKNPKPKQLINKFLQFLFFHWLLKKWKKYSINVTNLFSSNWLWLKG